MGMVTGWRVMGWDGVLFKNMQKIYEDMRKVMLAGPVEGSVHGSERQPVNYQQKVGSYPYVLLVRSPYYLIFESYIPSVLLSLS